MLAEQRIGLSSPHEDGRLAAERPPEVFPRGGGDLQSGFAELAPGRRSFAGCCGGGVCARAQYPEELEQVVGS